MYTICIIILIIISVLLIVYRFSLYREQAFACWLIAACIVGWTEFIWFLRHDAWIFNPDHIIGIRILNVTIEDYLFCPCFAIIFYWLYNATQRNLKQRVFNPRDKILFFLAAFAVALTYYDMGSQFSKYMCLRASLGFIGMVYCWNKVSFRHSLLFLLCVFVIGFGWDLPSVACKIWIYVQGDQPLPIIYDGLYFTILGAKFPIELFGYYFTGGFFSFWTIAFFKEYFFEQKRLDYEA